MHEWGVRVGTLLPHGSVVALHGELGAGKTTLARALCEGLGVVNEQVTSPTFAIVHEYDTASGVVAHADLYRLKNSGELENIGWDDLVARARVTIVEWPERAPEAIPGDALHCILAHTAAGEVRALTVV